MKSESVPIPELGACWCSEGPLAAEGRALRLDPPSECLWVKDSPGQSHLTLLSGVGEANESRLGSAEAGE